MSEMKPLEQHLTIIDEEGNEILCQILFTFESEELGKKYVLFYPLSSEEDEDGKVDVMAASYVEGEDGQGELSPVETDEEWALIEEVLQEFEESYDEEAEEEHHCCCGHHGDECCEEKDGCCEEKEECCCGHHGDECCEEKEECCCGHHHCKEEE